jgi:thymidine phosphorylase
MNGHVPTQLPLRRLGIDTYQEPVIYMHADCAVCRSEGFAAQSRIVVTLGARSVIATLNVIRSEWLNPHEAALSESAWVALDAHEGDRATLSHPEPLESFAAVRTKLYDHPFPASALRDVVRDISHGRYSALQMAAFVSACAGHSMSLDETVALTRAMVDAGERLRWPQCAPIVDKHCIGGLPGNRTTPIVAACGLTIPKTSSRAITSSAGTADTMETLAPVDLGLEQMRRVVEREGGCIVWGGAMALSPADDLLIRARSATGFRQRRPARRVGDLEEGRRRIDASDHRHAGRRHRKAAHGGGGTSPVGAPARGRAGTGTDRTRHRDRRQPVGRGIGPALEARDVLAVLQNAPAAPADLRERALLLAGALLELGDRAADGQGVALAAQTLASGAAWRKFLAICEAQGGLRTPPESTHRREFIATQDGRVQACDNRPLARAAKLAGAAGLALHVRLGDAVERGQPLFTLHAHSPGELNYAAAFLAAAALPVIIGDAP